MCCASAHFPCALAFASASEGLWALLRGLCCAVHHEAEGFVVGQRLPCPNLDMKMQAESWKLQL